jgi:hypothetical protein
VWIFFIFRSSKIRINPTGIIFSLFPSRCHLSSDWRHHATTPCHTSFPLIQDELIASTSSSSNASSSRLPSRAETKVLNLHHRRRPSPDRLTPTLHCYNPPLVKKVISTLTTLPITQPCLYFTSSLARAPHHQSSTHRSLLSSPHAHYPSAQWHPQWWISWHFFAFQTVYRYVNSRKKIF